MTIYRMHYRAKLKDDYEKEVLQAKLESCQENIQSIASALSSMHL